MEACKFYLMIKLIVSDTFDFAQHDGALAISAPAIGIECPVVLQPDILLKPAAIKKAKALLLGFDYEQFKTYILFCTILLQNL